MMPSQQREAIRAARLRDVRSVAARACYRAVISAFANAGAGHLLLASRMPYRQIERVLERLAVGGSESPHAAELQELLKRAPTRGTKVPQALLAWCRRNPLVVREIVERAAGKAA